MSDLDAWLDEGASADCLSTSEDPLPMYNVGYADGQKAEHDFMLLKQPPETESDRRLAIEPAPYALDELHLPAASLSGPTLDQMYKYFSRDSSPTSRSYNTRSSLSDAEVSTLLNIAMPQFASPEKSTDKEIIPKSAPVPEALVQTKLNKKRKLGAGSKTAQTAVTRTTKKQKQSHNTIEKRYRQNLNSKLHDLQQRVPSLRARSKCEPASRNAQDASSTSKHGKAATITEAIKYIDYLEQSIKQQGDEAFLMKTESMAFRKEVAIIGAVLVSNTASSQLLSAEPLDTIQEGELHLSCL